MTPENVTTRCRRSLAIARRPSPKEPIKTSAARSRLRPMDAPPIQYARAEDGVNIAYWTQGAVGIAGR